MPILTLSRQLGSLGNEISDSLSSRTGMPKITRNVFLERYLRDITSEYEYKLLNQSSKSFLFQNENTENLDFIRFGAKRLLEDSKKGGMILVGFGSQLLFSGHPDAFHIHIVSPMKTRIARIEKEYRLSPEDAAQAIRTADRKQSRFLRTVFDENPDNALLYDIALNTASFDVDVCTTTLLSAMEQWQYLKKNATENDFLGTINHQTERPVFHNDSEREFAHILDMYQIQWQYEPRTFPIKWDEDGNVSMAFSPDFYLPQFDTYLELTTMAQKYVTEKNKKARMVRELYPGTNVKIVYKKDFQSLVERFGKMGGIN